MKKSKRIISIIMAVFMVITVFIVPGGTVYADVDLETPVSESNEDGTSTVTWDCIYFGEYLQSADVNGGFTKEPIKWRVLDIEGDYALLLADKNLDAGAYNEELGNITWERSTIRSWLNGYNENENNCMRDYSYDNFIDEAFSEEEQKHIVTSFIHNEDNNWQGSLGGNDTYDKIFLLSISEATNVEHGFCDDQFEYDKARRVKNTAYAEYRGALTSETYQNGFWWLRSPGFVQDKATYIYSDGEVYDRYYYDGRCDIGIRPALRLDLSSNVWSYAGSVSSDGTVNEACVKEPVNKKVAVEYNPSEGDINKTISVHYKDEYFVGDNSEYDLGLAKVSLATTMASMSAMLDDAGKAVECREANIMKLLSDEMKFDCYTAYNYDVSLEDRSDKVAFSVAHKNIDINGENETIMAVVIRSGDYGNEWASNGRVEGYDGGVFHSGFNKAARGVVQEIQAYIEDNSIDHNVAKVWVTGFSRGGAVANLVGENLLHQGLIGEDNLYCYTFATPKTTQVPQMKRGIYNTINPIDLIPELPFSYWGFGYYGNNIYLPCVNNKNYSSDIKIVKDNFENITETNYSKYFNHHIFLSSLLTTLNCAVGSTEESYYENYQKYVCNVLADFLGEGSGDKWNIPKMMIALGVNLDSPVILPGLNVTSLIGAGGFQDLTLNRLNSYAMKQHWPEAYMAWLELGKYTTVKSYKNVVVKCPVNVTVYDENDQIVAQIIDDDALKFIEANPDIALEAYVDANGEKNIMIPEDGEYRVEVEATDDGKMNYSVEEYDDEGEISRKTNYSGIPIEEGDSFEGRVSEGEVSSIEEFDLVQNGTEVIESTKVLEGDELGTVKINVASKGDGYVVGGGAYNSGDSIILTAVPYENAVFKGWYENDEFISAEPVYGFIAEDSETREIKAKFTKALSDDNVYLYETDYNYTGRQIKPDFMASSGGDDPETLTEGVDYTVTYGQNKYPGKGTVKVTGIGEYSGTVVMTFDIARVQNLNVKSTGTNYIKLAWKKSPNVKGYKVYRLKNGKYKLIKTIKGSKYNYCTVKSLNAGTGYKFKVRTYAGLKPYYGTYSNELATPTKPGRVTITKLTTGKTHYVKAYWKKKTGTGYQIKLATNSKFTKGVKTFTVEPNRVLSKSIRDLTKGRTYYVKVRAYKWYGEVTKYGSWSKYKKIKCK